MMNTSVVIGLCLVVLGLIALVAVLGGYQVVSMLAAVIYFIVLLIGHEYLI